MIFAAITSHMSTAPTNNARTSFGKWPCCLVASLSGIVVLVLAFVGVRWNLRWQEEQIEKARRDRWESQIADVKAGKTTELSIDDDGPFVKFVEEQPEAAAKVARLVILTLGPRPGKVAGERFDNCVAQLEHLESIVFDETCDDVSPLLARLAHKKSITSLSFYMTDLTDEGVRAVASLPNLKHLHVDGHWNGLDWEPLRSHKCLESLVWEDAELTEERRKILASWPRLQKVAIEVPEADFEQLKKALPRVKEMSNRMK